MENEMKPAEIVNQERTTAEIKISELLENFTIETGFNVSSIRVRKTHDAFGKLEYVIDLEVGF